MKMTCSKKNGLGGMMVVAIMMLAVLIVGCGDGDEEPEKVTNSATNSISENKEAENDSAGVGGLWMSGCLKETRGDKVYESSLKLTLEGDVLTGELFNHWLNCAARLDKLVVEASAEDGQLSIRINEDVGNGADCVCPYNIRFTLFNVRADEYQLTLDGKDLGRISFKDSPTVSLTF